MREKHLLVASHMCPEWGQTTTLACALIRNRTSNLLLCGPMSNQLSHTGQDIHRGFKAMISTPSYLYEVMCNSHLIIKFINFTSVTLEILKLANVYDI